VNVSNLLLLELSILMNMKAGKRPLADDREMMRVRALAFIMKMMKMIGGFLELIDLFSTLLSFP
jgi:hypothetical protein